MFGVANTFHILKAFLILTMSSFLNIVDEDSTIEDVRQLISSSDLVLVLACASFAKKKCDPIVNDIKSRWEDDFPTSVPSVVLLNTDESDELEDIAVELGLNSIPSYQIYQNNKMVFAQNEDENVTYKSIRDTIQKVTSICSPASGCCPPSDGCCPTDHDDVLQLVAKSYANTLQKTESCCVSVDSTLNGYTAEELLKAGADSNLGLGCGHPLSFANATEGETIVDLGSGAGIDCFLASEKVGPSGLVIGVDMTPEMVSQARKNASGKKEFKNVQFRLGEIEYLPLGDNTANCVISNCVINLSPDKGQVFREIHRILKPGGRVAISDVVIRPEIQTIPEHLKTSEALAC